MNTEQERADFEMWCHTRSLDIGRDDNGDYISLETYLSWEAYQAGRAALQSHKPKPNDLMLSGVLRMPFKMAMATELSRYQFYRRAQQALNELEALQSQPTEAFPCRIIEADRKRRKPQHIDPELKAAIEDAATTRSPVAITKDGRGVMLNYGDEEDRMAEHEDNACAHCGGSGHKGDVADRKRRGEPVAWVKQDIAENQFINMRPRRIWWECNEGIGMPIFAAPQPTEPVKTLIDNQEPLGKEFQRVLDEHSWDLYVKTAEPVKVPSDGDIMVEWASTPNTGDMRVDLVVFARALLARYGNQTQEQP